MHHDIKKVFSYHNFYFFFQYVTERNFNQFNFQKVSKKMCQCTIHLLRNLCLRSFKQYVSREGLTECYLLQISLKETDTKKKKKQKKAFTDLSRNLVIPVKNLKINSIRYNLPSNHFKFLKQTKLISKKNTLGVVGIFHQTAMILISPYIHTDLILAINQTNHDINGHSETQWLSNLGFFSCTNVSFRSTISTIFL